MLLQFRMFSSPLGFCCFLLSDELMTAGNCTGDLVISDIRSPFQIIQLRLEDVSNGFHRFGGE